MVFYLVCQTTEWFFWVHVAVFHCSYHLRIIPWYCFQIFTRTTSTNWLPWWQFGGRISCFNKILFVVRCGTRPTLEVQLFLLTQSRFCLPEYEYEYAVRQALDLVVNNSFCVTCVITSTPTELCSQLHNFGGNHGLYGRLHTIGREPFKALATSRG